MNAKVTNQFFLMKENEALRKFSFRMERLQLIQLTMTWIKKYRQELDFADKTDLDKNIFYFILLNIFFRICF